MRETDFDPLDFVFFIDAQLSCTASTSINLVKWNENPKEYNNFCKNIWGSCVARQKCVCLYGEYFGKKKYVWQKTYSAHVEVMTSKIKFVVPGPLTCAHCHVCHKLYIYIIK